MGRRIVLLCVLGIWWSACGEEGPESPVSSLLLDASLPELPPPVPSEVDTQAPLFEGLTAASCLGWGRIQLEWAAAIDNLSRSHEIRYRIAGVDPGSYHDPLSVEEPDESRRTVVITEAGAVASTLTVPIEHSLFLVTALDSAGNASPAQLPRQVLTRPRLRRVSTEAVEGSLITCRRDASNRRICVGQNGRYSIWDGSTWREADLPSTSEIRLVWSPQDTTRLLVDADVYQLVEDGPPERLTLTFDGYPILPWRRCNEEPTGLLLLLDRTGQVWASGGLDFLLLDNPLLQAHGAHCAAIAELVLHTDRGFAWCRDGRQFFLRAGDRRYQWVELPEAGGLPIPPSPQRQVVFGEGRQISMLTFQGDVYRYDMGGWNPLYLAETAGTAATAINQGTESGHLLIAAQGQIFDVDAIGRTQDLASLEVRSPIIYFEPPADNALAITADGEVLSIPSGQYLRSLSYPTFGPVVIQSGQVVGILCRQPQLGLYWQQDGEWACRPLVSLPSGFVPHSIRRTLDGTLLIAGDGGAVGGQILRMDGNVAREQTWLYPPPPPPPEQAVTPPVSPPPEQPVVPEEPPIPLLVGVPAGQLPQLPPTPPTVRAIDLDETTGTRVAAGEDGSLWLWIDTGWLAVDSGVPGDLLSVLVLGDHRYLVGGAGGLLLVCEWNQCTSVQVDIGEVRRLVRQEDVVWALGANGLARFLEDGSFQVTPPIFSPPYPSSQPPTGFLAIEEHQGERWLLGDDGSVWLEVDGRYQAMASVDEPLDLFVEEGGRVLVATRTELYALDPPDNR